MHLFHGSSLAVSILFGNGSNGGGLMSKEKFEAMLILIVPMVIGLIMQKCGLDELTATRAFYESKVYSLLEQEDTKLWHFSPLTLFCMYEEEQRTGDFSIPEG